MKSIKNISIRKYLTLLILLALSPVSCLVVYNDYRDYQSDLESTKFEIQRVSDISTARLSEIIAGAKQTLLTLGNLEEIQDNDIEKSEAILKATMSNTKFYTSIGVCDTMGNALALSQKVEVKPNFSDRIWFKRAKSGKGVYIGDYQIGKITKLPGISLGLKIKSTKKPYKESILYISINLKELNRIIVATQLPAGCILNIIDRNGTLIARNPNIENVIGQKSQAWPIYKVRPKDNSGFVEANGVDGESRLYAFSLVPESDEGFYVGIGASKTFYDNLLYERIIDNIIKLVLALIIALLVSYWVGKKNIEDQIRYLSNVSNLISQDKKIEKFESIGGAFELKQLLNAFKNMYESVQSHRNNLEALVEERTIKLQERNLQLAEEIEERKKVETALVDREANYRNLFEAANEIIFITKNVKIIRANAKASELLGFTEEELLNKFAYDLVYKDDVENIKNKLIQLRAHEINTASGEFRIVTKSGNLIWTMYSVIDIEWQGENAALCMITNINDRVIAEENLKKLNEDLENKVLERTASLNDVMLKLEEANIELKQMNENIWEDAKRLQNLNDELADSQLELKKANESKDRFISILAHDLKNPIGGIRLILETILAYHEMMTKEELISQIKAGYISSNNVSDLLDNLLQWALMQKGAIEFNPETLKIYDLVEKNINILNVIAAKKNIQISCNTANHTLVYADFNYLNTIVRNLLTNAIKFTPDGGEITVEVKENITVKGEKNNVDLIIVKDNGVGMTQEFAGNLFKIEKAISRPGTNNEKGNGLGLILCKEFVEKHGGKIWVESTPGMGSEFHFSLPRYEP